MDAETVSIIATIDDEELKHVGHTFTLRNGVVLAFRKVPTKLAAAALEKLEEPPVPTIYIEDKETYEENPGDPDYIKAVETFNNKRATLMTDIYTVRGTELKSLPEDLEGPDSDSWIEEAEYLGATITNKDSKIARYAQWLSYVAFTEVTEMLFLVNAVMYYNNLIDEDTVLKEMYFFRHPEERPEPDTSTDQEALKYQRDVPVDDTRDDLGVRTAGGSKLRPVLVETVPETNNSRKNKVTSSL